MHIDNELLYYGTELQTHCSFSSFIFPFSVVVLFLKVNLCHIFHDNYISYILQTWYTEVDGYCMRDSEFDSLSIFFHLFIHLKILSHTFLRNYSS